MKIPKVTINKRNLIHGTAVFLARTPSQIIVSADSRKSDSDGNPISDEVCKIRKFGSGYIVMNGFTESEESGYDFLSILKEVINENESLSKNLERLEEKVEPILTLAVKKVRLENEVSFQRNLLEKPPLGFCVFGVDNGRLVFYQRGFNVVLSESGEVTLKKDGRNVPSNDNPGGLAFYLVGLENIEEEFLRKYPDLPKRRVNGSLITISREFIQMQIDAGVTDVGGPIDILRVTLESSNWVQRKACCEDE